MRSGQLELQPAREFVQRMRELEDELQRARQAQRRLKANPDTASRWGLDTHPAAPQEDGWFLTYLDMMTLLLVAMIVMLAFSGNLARHDGLLAEATAAPVIAGVASSYSAAESARPASALPMSETSEDTDSPAAAHPDDIPAPDAAFPYPAAPTTAFEQSGYPSDAIAALAAAYPTPMDLAPKPAPEIEPAVVTSALTPSETPAATTVLVAAAAAPPASVSLSSPPAATPPDMALPPNETQTSPASLTLASDAVSPPVPELPLPPTPPDNAPSEGESLAAALPLGELGSEVEVIINQRSVSLRINNEILFGTGQADLSPHGSTVLKRMAEVLSRDGYHIVVEGHTDSVPVRSNSRYPSNWELSSDRAGSVVRYLLANGIDKAHVKTVGYADTRPIADNQSADGRARNRRVELVVEKNDPDAPKTP